MGSFERKNPREATTRICVHARFIMQTFKPGVAQNREGNFDRTYNKATSWAAIYIHVRNVDAPNFPPFFRYG